MVEQEQGGVAHGRFFALTGCSACVGAAQQAHDPCWPPLNATPLSKDFYCIRAQPALAIFCVLLPGGGICAPQCSHSHGHLFAAANLAASNARKRAARPPRAHKPFTLQPPPFFSISTTCASPTMSVGDGGHPCAASKLLRHQHFAVLGCAIKQVAVRVGGGSSPAPLDRVFYCKHFARGIKPLDFLRRIAARPGLAPRKQRLLYGCVRYDTVGRLLRIACES